MIIWLLYPYNQNMSVSLWLSHYNSKAISHIFKCLPCWVAGWSLFSQFTLFCACWDSAVWGQSPPRCLVVYSSTCLPPKSHHSCTVPPVFLHFQIQNCTLKLQISNFRFKSAMLLLFCHLSTSHSSCTVFPFCWTFVHFFMVFISMQTCFFKVDKKQPTPSDLLRDQ